MCSTVHYHSIARAFQTVHTNGCDSDNVPTSQKYCSVVESWSNMFQAGIRHDVVSGECRLS
jgi:hypothetical protein